MLALKVRSSATLAFDRRAYGSGSDAFAEARRSENAYARMLRGIARQVGQIVEGLAHGRDPALVWREISSALRNYAETIEPWARAVSVRMLADVDHRDEAAWNTVGRQMSRALRDEVRNAPTGQLFRDLMQEQVTLIKSLPLEAAERVHEWVIKGQTSASRSEDVVAEIMRTGQVTKARATMIARTETARAASTLLEARARHIGCTHYVWHTAGDGRVRLSHRRLNGHSFRWDQPPECDPGIRAGPGRTPNCRCWPAPIIPEF